MIKFDKDEYEQPLIYSTEDEIRYKSSNEINEEIEKIQKENQELKKQLEYLRNGEYLNQLKFERLTIKSQ